MMNLREQIAKEVMFALHDHLDSDHDWKIKFFDEYDKQCNIEGFSSNMITDDNYQSIMWEFGNIKRPDLEMFATRCSFSDKAMEMKPNLRLEIDKVIENVTNGYPLNVAQKAVDKVDSSERELISDGFHSFKELYETRLALTASLFNLKQEYLQNKYGMGIISREDYDKFKPYKSKKHSDGELCFGGGWFITGFLTESGQVSFHYEMKDWDLFNITILEQAPEWDGHTTQDVNKRLIVQ